MVFKMEKIVELHPGDIIRHYKIHTDGTGIRRYIVLDTGVIDTERVEELVIYQALYHPYKKFARPVSMFSDIVETTASGKPVYRFSKEEDAIQFKLMNLKDIKQLFDAVELCSSTVELVSQEGDRLNLKSELSKKLLAANIFSHGEVVKQLDLVVWEPSDIQYFIDLITD